DGAEHWSRGRAEAAERRGARSRRGRGEVGGWRQHCLEAELKNGVSSTPCSGSAGAPTCPGAARKGLRCMQSAISMEAVSVEHVAEALGQNGPRVTRRSYLAPGAEQSSRTGKVERLITGPREGPRRPGRSPPHGVASATWASHMRIV